jgi:DNA invertase Pin-like site-specific DNA recombinase
MPRRTKRPAKPPTAVACIRVSTDERRQELGAAAQRAAIEAWEQATGIRVVAWHLDEVSGGAPLDERDGLVAALADVEAQRATHLVFSTLDRFSRDPASAALVEAELQRCNASVVFADGSGNGDDEGSEMMRGMRLVVARFERKLIAKRIKAALAVKQARGEMTGAAPFGMRAVPGPLRAGRDGITKPVQLLEPEPTEQAVIARAVALRATGETIRDVTASLAGEGYVGRAGKPLTRDAVDKLLARAAP